MDITFVLGLLFNKQVKEAVLSLALDKTFTFLYNKLKRSEVDKAYKRAVKRWNTSSYVRKSYLDQKFETLQEFADYVINRQNDGSVNGLFQLFEEELRKDQETYQLLLELRVLATSNGIDKMMRGLQDISAKQAAHTQLLQEISQSLCELNRGVRIFKEPQDYIQRKCTLRIGDSDFISYFLNPQKYHAYPLVDFVLCKTENTGNKFVFYSDAQSGKTTELRKLGWDLQEEGTFVPILFEVKGHPQLMNDLPALSEKQEKAVVLIIDALDERYDGDKRYDLYNEMKTYAKEHPYLRIVLSCRSNFKGEASLDSFVSLSLNDLSYDDACSYMHSKNCDKLVAEIEKSNLYEFIRIPFYLMSLVDYYKEKHALPNNKGELYDFFIEKRLKDEENKHIKKTSQMVRKGKVALQRMAIAIQLMNVNDMSEDDILDLENGDEEQLDRVLHSGLLEETEVQKYGFIHNAFKEYLVSRYLFQINDIKKIQEISCYKGTKTIRPTWYNTIALLLSQLPKSDLLTQQVLDWIVNDNKLMVLYVDSNMFEISLRINLFREIVEGCKIKNLRLDDYSSSKYKALMAFGFSEETVSYLIAELDGICEMDNHLVNLLSLIRYLPFTLLEDHKAIRIKEQLLKIFATYIQEPENAYVLFVVFENPDILSKEIADSIYDIIRDAEHPNVVNNFVDYVVKAGCVEQYIDIILQKGRFVRDYRINGYTRHVSRDTLYEAYSSVRSWDCIKKVLWQLTQEFKDLHYHIDSDKKEFNRILSDLLRRAIGFCKNNTENADFVYSCLLEMGKEWHDLKTEITEPYLEFFKTIDKEQYYFEKSLATLRKQLTDWEHHDYERQMSVAYCTAIFMTEDRIEQICSEIGENTEEGNSVLMWIANFSSLNIAVQIEVVRRNRFSSFWKEQKKVSDYDLQRQHDFNELMNYDAFRKSVLRLIDEKAPQNRQELNALRRVKVHFVDNDEEVINHYVFSLFYEFRAEDDTYDLSAIRDFVCDYKEYHKFLVSITVPLLYSENSCIVLNREQKAELSAAAKEWLSELAEGNYWPGYQYACPPISVLLHGDVEIEDELLLQLLPYSSCSIHQVDEMNVSHNYTLFDYCRDRKSLSLKELCGKIIECALDKNLCHEQNLKLWGTYLVENNISKEYKTVINWMQNMPDCDPAYRLIITLLENTVTKRMLIQEEELANCSENKRVFIYQKLASDVTNNDFVISHIEKEFDQYNDFNKKNALAILLNKGSMFGVKYMASHIDMVDFRTSAHYTSIEALSYLLDAYSKVIDKKFRVDYGFIMNAIEEMALNSTKNWQIIKGEFEKMIMSDRKKYVHLNFYLNKWEKEIMEKNTPEIKIEDVKHYLCIINSKNNS